jgi:hypothetical protein
MMTRLINDVRLGHFLILDCCAGQSDARLACSKVILVAARCALARNWTRERSARTKKPPPGWGEPECGGCCCLAD